LINDDDDDDDDDDNNNNGEKNSPTVTHACRKRRLKWVPGAWGV